MAESHADVGVDIGKSRLAIGWPHFRVARSIDLGKNSGMPRHLELATLQDWMHNNVPSGAQLWIDQAFAGSGAVAMAQRLTETISAVLTARRWTLPPIIVHQATWKSQVIGNHMASKDEIRDFVEQHHPKLAERCDTEDEYDAMVIGLYGKGRSEGAYNAPDVRRPKRRSKKP